MTNAERQRRWRERHPGHARPVPVKVRTELEEAKAELASLRAQAAQLTRLPGLEALKQWTLADEDRVRAQVEEYNRRFDAWDEQSSDEEDFPAYDGEDEPMFLRATLKMWEEITRPGVKNGTCRDNYVTFETVVAQEFGLIETIERYRADLKRRKAREAKAAKTKAHKAAVTP